MLTNEAITTPINPMKRNDPIATKLRFVVYPYMLIAANTEAVIKKTLAKLAPVYIKKICERERPIITENAQNINCAELTLILAMFMLNNITKIRGANMTKYPSPDSPETSPEAVVAYRSDIIRWLSEEKYATAPVSDKAIVM